MMIKLYAEYDADRQRQAAKEERLNFRKITSSMSAREAADEYAKTLQALKGFDYPDFDVSFE